MPKNKQSTYLDNLIVNTADERLLVLDNEIHFMNCYHCLLTREDLDQTSLPYLLL
jgi:hypothetical protein